MLLAAKVVAGRTPFGWRRGWRRRREKASDGWPVVGPGLKESLKRVLCRYILWRRGVTMARIVYGAGAQVTETIIMTS